MIYRNSWLVIVKEAIKKPLKSCRLGKKFYPYVQAIYRKYAQPMKCRRLRKNGAQVLSRFEGFMTQWNIPHCYAFGTLLGFVRDKGFIKHDDDIDVTILPGTIAPADLLKKFLEVGYGFIHGFGYEGKLLEFTIADPSQVTIDVFFPVVNPVDSSFFDFTIPFWKPEVEYPNEKANNVRLTTYLADKDIREYDLFGIKLPIAGNYEDVLESTYGSWKVPDPNYCPESRIKVNVLPGYAYRLTKEEALAFK